MTPESFLPFALPDIGDEEIAEVVSSLRSGWVTTGPKCKQFEGDFSAWLGGGVNCLAVNSATAGLHLALEAAGIGPGDEVITTTYTFTATAEVIRYLGAEPVFVDISANTLCIDPRAVERAISPRTKAIIPVHLGGRAADMSQLLSLARRYRLRIIEDAAHALPTTHAGKLIGTLDSDATVFSFYATKTITTGEGGMVVTRDGELARRVSTMRLHGISRDAFDRYTARSASWRYDVVAPGYKYNLTDLAASIGIHQLRKAHAFHRRRAAIAKRYDSAFSDLPLLLPPHAADNDVHAWHLYIVRLLPAAGLTRDDFIERIFSRGIGVSVHFIPLHLQPYWRERYRLTPELFPVSQSAFEQAVSLPLYTRMTDEDVDRVIASVRAALK